MDAQHPTDQMLSSYGLGKLDDGSAEAINQHLEECRDCRKRVSQMSSDSFLDRVRNAQADGLAIGPSQPDGTKNHERLISAPPPPASTLPPGLAGHSDYEIKQELGRGGMGVVYLAHNKLMGRDEVLKVIGRRVIERPDVLDRFLREIRAVAKLRHPNIVAAYSAARLGESIVFAMEYVDGLDLSKMVKGKAPLPVAHACLYAHQAALGLQHAHEEGLVHRDIKPHNLMLSRNTDKPTIKVLDFGLAKVAREEKIEGGLTMEGQALGTPDYIAPEQIVDSHRADIRADIYSLGGTLYYLLTGRPPFRASSLYDMYQAHISRDADPLNLIRPEVPFELAALVAKMMAKDATKRYQTPGEVAKALMPFFQNGNRAFKSPPTDVSLGGPTNAARPAAQQVHTPPQPVKDPGQPVVRAKQAVEPTVAKDRLASLIDFKESESSIEATPILDPVWRRPSSPWLKVVAASLFGLTAFGIIVIIRHPSDESRITTPDGTAIAVEANKSLIASNGLPVVSDSRRVSRRGLSRRLPTEWMLRLSLPPVAGPDRRGVTSGRSTRRTPFESVGEHVRTPHSSRSC